MKQPNSVRVAVLDDDDLARLGVVSLLTRDLRTSVLYDCASPEEFMAWLMQNPVKPQMLLLDMEYRSATYPLRALLSRLREYYPNVKVVGLSKYGEVKTLSLAVEYGLAGYLLKGEASLALATALVTALEAEFICTRGALVFLEQVKRELAERATVQEAWQMHPELTPRLRQVFWMCLVYGMSARMAANEMVVTHNSVERYRNRIYQILSDDWYYDGSSLAPWEHLLHPNRPEDEDTRRNAFWGQEWAYQLMTMPPLRQVSGYPA